MFRFICLLCFFSGALAGLLRPLPVSLPRLDGRIVGGEDTTIEKHRWQVSLQYFGSHTCGASIISPKWILTANHCAQYTTKYYTVRAGTTTRGSGGTVYSVEKVVKHPKYNTSNYDNDFALMKISGTFNFGESQGPVALPDQDEIVAKGTMAVVTGWGALTEGGMSATLLQQVAVPIISNEECNEKYLPLGTNRVTAAMVCAGYPAGGKDACQGDSGGPLVADRKLIGVVSWGRGCARPDFPGVYSRVAAVRQWIRETADV